MLKTWNGWFHACFHAKSKQIELAFLVIQEEIKTSTPNNSIFTEKLFLEMRIWNIGSPTNLLLYSPKLPLRHGLWSSVAWMDTYVF